MLQNSSMIFKSLVSTKRHILILCQPSLNHTHILRCPAHAHASARTVVLLAPRCPGFRHRRKFTLDPHAAWKINESKMGFFWGTIYRQKITGPCLSFYIYIYNPFQQKKIQISPHLHLLIQGKNVHQDVLRIGQRIKDGPPGDASQRRVGWIRGMKIHLLDWKNTWWRELVNLLLGWWSSLHCSEVRIKIPFKVPV